MMRNIILALGLGALLVAGITGGRNAYGRVALGLGAPSLAAAIFESDDWRGAALYRAGKYQAAAEAFAQAGPEAAYNLGNARVQLEEYAAALEAYDLALAYRVDSRARVNFDLVRAFYGGTRLDPDSIAKWGRDREGDTVEGEIAKGTARASGTGDEVTNTGATVGVPAMQSREQYGARKVFDDKFVIASPRWLETLQDVPGAYLAARISHEFKRRRKAGVGQPPMEREW